jgi:hypothetical protein
VTLGEKRALGHSGEVAFCRFALERGRRIRAAHPAVLAELDITDAKALNDHASAFGDVSLHGLVPALHEVKDKRKSGPVPGGPYGGCYGWEVERLRKTLAATDGIPCLAYYTIRDRAGWLTVMVLALASLHARGTLRVATKGTAAESLHAGQMRTEPMGVLYIPVRFFKPLEATWPRRTD